jgi:NAD(P)-dependent dehydrogenase (short-subunit alcohol dehydrogenase family)
MNERVVLITGGAGNLGQVVTRVFLEAGVRVAVPFYKTDHTAPLDRLAATFGDRLNFYALDLTTERGAEQAVRQAVEWGGSLGAVVHLVGGYSGGTLLADTPLAVWTRMIDLNLTSAYLVSRFAIPRLLEAGQGGSLVFVSSRAALEGRRERGAYAASKAGLIALAQAIAEEYAARGLRSNVLLPDTIDTEDNRRAMPAANRTSWIAPEAVARTILFLASDASRAITGAAVPLFAPG